MLLFCFLFVALLFLTTRIFLLLFNTKTCGCMPPNVIKSKCFVLLPALHASRTEIAMSSDALEDRCTIYRKSLQANAVVTEAGARLCGDSVIEPLAGFTVKDCQEISRPVAVELTRNTERTCVKKYAISCLNDGYVGLGALCEKQHARAILLARCKSARWWCSGLCTGTGAWSCTCAV